MDGRVRQLFLKAALYKLLQRIQRLGLIIAIGNEYAASNPKSVREKQKTVKEICQRPEMAKAIAEITPVGLSPNKQMVANFVKRGRFFILTQMYRLKNRI